MGIVTFGGRVRKNRVTHSLCQYLQVALSMQFHLEPLKFDTQSRICLN